MNADTPTSETVKERPILFSGPMVRAILEGRKTQTRRVVKRQPVNPKGPDFDGLFTDTIDPVTRIFACPYGIRGERLWVRETWMPFGLYGSEVDDPRICVGYRASNDVRPDGVKHEDFGASKVFPCTPEEWLKWRAEISRMEVEGDAWRPSIHLPRRWSRITLEVVKVRVERLQDISEEDALAEGIEALHCHPGEKTFWKNYRFKTAHPRRGVKVIDEEHRIQAYRNMVGGTKFADQVGAIRSYQSLWESINGVDSWEANPWVWVVEFKRVDGGDGQAGGLTPAVRRDA